MQNYRFGRPQVQILVIKDRVLSISLLFFSSDPNADTAYVFIDNFCALEKDEEILNIWGGKFALQAFTFVEADSEIFLHCEVCLKNSFDRYRRKRPKVDASIFDSALSHTRRSDAWEKKRRQ